MKRWLLMVVAVAVGLIALPSATMVSAGSDAVIRLGTLAPAGSSWDRVYKAWANTLSQETGGSLKLQVYPGGSAGDERDVLRKMKVSQMDAGSFSSVGLSLVARSLGVLQVPGMIVDYKQLNKVRDELAPDFEAIFEKEGYKLVGWGDAGFVRILSNQPILVPSDYKKVRPWIPADDAAAPVLMKLAGANPVASGIPEVVAGLQTGMIDSVFASAIAAVGLQWFRNLKYVSKETAGPIVGATLVRAEYFKALSPEHQEVLLKTGKKAHATLIKLIEAEDARAYKTLVEKAKLQEFSTLGTPEQEKAWTELNTKLRKELTGKLWTKEFYEKVAKVATKHGGSKYTAVY